MPGFSEGMHNISRDEQRHIGFGVKTLSEMFAQSEECKAAVAELLGEVLPCSLTIFVQPNWDLRYTREYGFELEDIYAFGLRSVRAKWRAAGYPIEEMPAGRLSARSRPRRGGDRPPAGPLAALRGDRRARHADRRALPGGATDLLRHRRERRRQGARRPADDDPVALLRRRQPAPPGWTTARPAPSPATRHAPTLPSRRAGRTGSTSRCTVSNPGARCSGGACARAARSPACAGCSASSRAARRSLERGLGSRKA